MRTLFSEHFTGDSPKVYRWNVMDDLSATKVANHCMTGTGIQGYTPSEVKVSNGLCSLTATELKAPIGAYNYTSGGMTTEGKFSFLYGRVDVEAQVRVTNGSWPAFWLINNGDVSWFAQYEIDFMEMRDVDTTLGTYVHSYKEHDPGETAVVVNDGPFSTVPPLGLAMHKYSVDWRKGWIKYYLDDKLLDTTTNLSIIPTRPMYLLVDNAVGGWSTITSQSVFPISVDIKSIVVV